MVKQRRVPVPRRILILRPDNLGDLVLFSGALRHIRGHWPEAEITLCVRGFGIELFTHCPYINKVLAYERLVRNVLRRGRLPWIPPFRGSERLSAALLRISQGRTIDAYRFNTVILPILSPCSEHHECIKRIPSDSRIGIRGNTTNQSAQIDRDSRPWYSAQMDGSKLPWNLPEREVTRDFLEFLGIRVNTSEIWPEFWTVADDHQKIDRWIPMERRGITLGIAPGYSASWKYLPPEWFVKALDGLPHSNLQLVLIGSVADVPLCNEITKAIGKHYASALVINLSGKTSVREMVECVRRCDLLLCQDNASLHVATALRKPVVGIVGGGQYGRFFPWGDPQLARVIRKPMECYGCNWICRYESVRCIAEIAPEDAAVELRILLEYLQSKTQ